MTPDMPLEEGEVIRWEGRPAPRCFTFRQWRHALFGLFFLALAAWWQLLGIEMAATYAIPWLAWLPLPFVAAGLYLSAGRLLLARLEWEKVLYLITDRRLLVRRGLLTPRIEAMPLAEVTYFRLDRHGEELGTLRVHRGAARHLTLYCVEHPRRATPFLEDAIAARQLEG